MKCLSVCQPWAWAIVNGVKAVENRSWRTAHRGPILIHAGKSRRWLGAEELPEAPEEGELPFGFVVGGVEVLDCVPVGEVRDRRFAFGPWCWILARPWKLDHPVALAGKLWLFDVDFTR